MAEMGSAQGQGLTPGADCRAPLLMGSSQQSRDGVLIGMPVYVKELIAGGVAGGFAKTAVAPLERIKILFQTRKGDFQSLGVWSSLGRILRTEGVFGFYRGNGASVLRIVPYAALHFMTYEQYRRWIVDYYPSIGTGPVVDLLAGSVAGGTAVLFTYPLDLARTRLAFEVKGYYKTGWDNGMRSVRLQSAYKGVIDVFTKVYREGGLRGLYRGVGPSLYGIFPYAGLKFFVYEELKSHLPKEQQKSMLAKLACGSLAGLLGQTFTYPLDVVRRQMQVQTLPITKNGSPSVQLPEPQLKGTFQGLATIVQKQGWKQLFAGLSINYLKVVPSVAIGFTAYDGMKSWLGVPPREKTHGGTTE